MPKINVANNGKSFFCKESESVSKEIILFGRKFIIKGDSHRIRDRYKIPRDVALLLPAVTATALTLGAAAPLLLLPLFVTGMDIHDLCKTKPYQTLKFPVVDDDCTISAIYIDAQ